MFRSFVERAVTAGASWARILAEPPWRGRNDEEKRVLMVVESLLDLTFSPLPVTMLCPYDERLVDQKVIEEAKLIHPHIRRGEEIVENDTYRNSAEIALDSATSASNRVADFGVIRQALLDRSSSRSPERL